MTPILAMAWELYISGQSFECHLSARSNDRVAFGTSLKALPFADKIRIYLDDDQTQSLGIRHLIRAHDLNTHLYVCGPKGYMDFVQKEAATAGLASEQIHVEHFGAEIDVDGDPFEVVAQKSGVTVQVGPNQTILEALNIAGISVPTSCQNGVCGSCLTPVVEGKPDHRDLVLTDVEKSANDRIAVCCSRSNSLR